MAPRGMWPPFEWNPADLDDPLIGRDDALAELIGAFEEVITAWELRVQLLVSEYGIGKWRLASAFIDEATARAPDTFVVRVKCPATGGPYRMWDRVLRAAFEIPTAADDVEAGALLVEAIERYLPAEAEEVSALVAWIVGYEVPGRPTLPLGADEDALVARCVGALGRLFEAIAFERPLLVVVGSANLASARDFSLASALEATVKGRPIMLVFMGSPELTDHLPGWDRFPVCQLGPLGRADAERLLRIFLSGIAGAPPRALVDRILDNAKGNAFAIKAMVRFLAESGVIVERASGWVIEPRDAIVIPEDLAGVILARIGALAPEERQLIAQAAVVGRHFWLGALVALARQDAEVELDSDEAPALIRATLAKFVAQRFIEVRTSHLPGEEAFSFRSRGHWEAAFGLLPATLRQRHHRVVHSWLSLQADEEEGPFLAELARHAEGAGDPGGAAEYYLRAAKLALDEGRSKVALASLDKAHALVSPEQTATRLKVLFELGELHVFAGATDESKRYFSEALELAWRMRDRRRGARAWIALARVEELRGEYEQAHAHYTEGLRLFEAIEDHAGVASSSTQLGRLHWVRGEFDKALLCYRKGEHTYRRLHNERGMGEILHAMGAVYYDRGDVALAEEYYQRALELRQTSGDRRGLARTLNNLGVIWMGSSLERSVEVWQRALEIAEEIGDLGLQATLGDNLGEVLVLLGRYDEADDHLARAVALAERTGRKRTLVDALRNQAGLRVARGDWDGAEEVLNRARAQAAALGLARLNGLVARALGDLAVARMEATGVIAEEDGRGALISAEIAYRRAAQAFGEAGYRHEAARSHERLAEMLVLAGRRDEAGTERARAAALRISSGAPNAQAPA